MTMDSITPIIFDESIVPPAPVALIDGYLASLTGDMIYVEVKVVRDLLLDIRNAIWRPALTGLVPVVPHPDH